MTRPPQYLQSAFTESLRTRDLYLQRPVQWSARKPKLHLLKRGKICVFKTDGSDHNKTTLVRSKTKRDMNCATIFVSWAQNARAFTIFNTQQRPIKPLTIDYWLFHWKEGLASHFTPFALIALRRLVIIYSLWYMFVILLLFEDWWVRVGDISVTVYKRSSFCRFAEVFVVLPRISKLVGQVVLKAPY